MLHEPTLVLNRNWVAVATTSVRTALVMVYRGTAHVIDPETFEVFDFHGWSDRPVGERSLGTSRSRIRVPEVVLLDLYEGHPSRDVPFSRKNLYRRDELQCQYCGRDFPARKLSVDHIKPRSRGGVTSWENCVLACIPCNVKKADQPPAARGMRLLRLPRPPRWDPCMGLADGVRHKSWERFLGDR